MRGGGQAGPGVGMPAWQAIVWIRRCFRQPGNICRPQSRKDFNTEEVGRATESHGVRVQSASREAQSALCSVVLRGPPIFLRVENLTDVPPPRSLRRTTKGKPVRSNAEAIVRPSVAIEPQSVARAFIDCGVIDIDDDRRLTGETATCGIISPPMSSSGCCRTQDCRFRALITDAMPGSGISVVRSLTFLRGQVPGTGIYSTMRSQIIRVLASPGYS
jgi:hypothetical protein